ncbi:succinic semialdehyde dehydrogenase [Dermacoccaceae bacterium W4C1]
MTTTTGSTRATSPEPAAVDLSPAPHAVPAGLVERLSRRAVVPARPETYDCLTPFTGKSLGQVPLSTVDSVDEAYRLAREAQPRWARTPVRERARFLLRLHDLVLKHRNELMDLIQLESGKARMHAFEEVLDVAGISRHYARAGEKYLAPQRHLGALPVLTKTVELRHPKGVVGVVAPWNYPLSMSITDALPALLAGNAVVLRPDLESALTALRAVELIDQAGLPEGLLQVVLGDGPSIGSAVLERADYVMYTGSTATGRIVAAQAGERLVGASLELGGKNSMYVAADADISRAAECAVRSSFGSAGQLCISTERLVVHEAVVEEFTAKFVQRVKAMKLSSDLRFGSDMGSLLSHRQFEKVTEHVEDARAKGATILAGGKPRPDLGPYFYEPTVLVGVTAAMTCRDEETFGPVVAIHTVAGDDEAVRLINDTAYGLNAAVWTRDTKRGLAVAARIRTGTVNVNEGYAPAWGSNGSPMGGMGQSGIGRRHGAEGITKYTESQTIATQRLLGFGAPAGIGQKAFTAALTTGLRVMKWGRLS